MPKRFRYDDLRSVPGFRFEITTGLSQMENFPHHSHEFTELVLVLGGTALHRTGGDDYILRTGDVYVINPGASHAFASMQNLNQCHVMFDPAIFLQPVARDLKQLSGYHALFVLEPQARAAGGFKSRLRLRGAELAEARRLTESMTREFHKKRGCYQTVITGLFWQYAGLLCRCYESQPIEEGTSLPLARAVSHMESHFAEPLRLEALARLAHYSVPQFCRLFRKYYGTSPVDYLLRLRIERAAELLKEDGHRITNIAESCGFSDSNYFARQFRKVMGRAPREFRNPV